MLVELLRIASLVLDTSPQLLAPRARQLMALCWPLLKRDNAAVTNAAYFVLSLCLRNFPVSDEVTLQVCVYVCVRVCVCVRVRACVCVCVCVQAQAERPPSRVAPVCRVLCHPSATASCAALVRGGRCPQAGPGSGGGCGGGVALQVHMLNLLNLLPWWTAFGSVRHARLRVQPQPSCSLAAAAWWCQPSFPPLGPLSWQPPRAVPRRYALRLARPRRRHLPPCICALRDT